MKNIITIISIALLVLSCGSKTSQNVESQKAETKTISKDTVAKVVYENNYLVKVGDVAPDFTLNLTDGTAFK